MGSMTTLTRRSLLCGAAAVGLCTVATAFDSACASVPIGRSPATKVPRIGILNFGTPDSPVALETHAAFDEGLRQLGWIEGHTVHVERRYVGTDAMDQQLVSDLIKQRVDVLVVSGSVQAAQAAMQMTSSIPIVVIGIPHPVQAGLVSNLVRPGGNLTVLSADAPGISAKSVELLRDVVPQLRRLAVMLNSSGSRPQSVAKWDEIRTAAEGVGIDTRAIELRTAEEAEHAFDEVAAYRADAVYDAFAALTAMDPSSYAGPALEHHLPYMTTVTENVQSGFLMAYGPDFPSIYRRAAVYVDKVLKGASAGDLPVEQPTVFNLAVNLRTAQVLGLTIPADVAAQVTQWIQ